MPGCFSSNLSTVREWMWGYDGNGSVEAGEWDAADRRTSWMTDGIRAKLEAMFGGKKHKGKGREDV